MKDVISEILLKAIKKAGVSLKKEEIEKTKKEIKIVDDKLSDSSQYQTIINDKEAFAKYEQTKKQLEAEMLNWESLQGKLEN